LLKGEVDDPADADDVREDREAELSAIGKKIRAQLTRIESWLRQ